MTLSLQNALEVVAYHGFRLLTDELFVAERLVVVALLYEFQPFAVEGIDFDSVYVGPGVVESHLFHYDDTVAESYAFVVAVSVAALVFLAEEHLLTFVPHRNMNSWVAKCWQDLVEQVFVDRFCK